MRIFNPFKPHICEFATGGFAVRRFSLAFLSWEYLDRDTIRFSHTWWDKRFAHYALYTDPSYAVDRLKVLYARKPPFSKLYAY